MRAETPLQILERGAAELGVVLSPVQLGQFERYLTELQKWNRRTNLTGTNDLQEIIPKHVLDSLAGLAVLNDLPSGSEIADLGAGAGFPGLPIKIARPDLRMTLIEPRQKRAAFLTTVCALIKLRDVEIIETRVGPKYLPADLSARFACVVMRAVADPSRAAKLAGPLLKPGGRIVVWASQQQAGESGTAFSVYRYRIPRTNITHALLIPQAAI